MRMSFLNALMAASAFVPAIASAQDIPADVNAGTTIRDEVRANIRAQRQEDAQAAPRPAPAPQAAEFQRRERGDGGGFNRGGDGGGFDRGNRPERQFERPQPQFQAQPQAQAQAQAQANFRAEQPRPQVQQPQPNPERQAFRQDRRDDRQAFQGQRRDDRRDFRAERRDDRQDLANGTVTQPAFRADRRDDRHEFEGQRRDARQDFRGDRREDRQTWQAGQRAGGAARVGNGQGNWQSRNDGYRNDDRSRQNYGVNRWSGSSYDQNRSWNRDWRRDGRYDWNGYRGTNRNVFNLPRYYAPYGWSYGYRRFSIGLTLNSILFDENYWIEDAQYYRLPPAYGPYRWVRYYNDALLVDIRSGYVVDTVYDIFW